MSLGLSLIGKEPRRLISIFVSFLFGREEGLGYDPAIRRFLGDRVYYEYEVGNKYYRTLGSLSSYRSLGITGRMTRVWRATEITGFNGSIIDEKEVALKDVWLDQNASTERQIQNKIFEAIDREKLLLERGGASRLKMFAGEALADVHGRAEAELKSGKFRDYFMTIHCDHVGQVTKPAPAGAIPTCGLFTDPGDTQCRNVRLEGSDPSRDHDINVRPSSSSARRSDASAQVTPCAPTTYTARQYQPKKRYFLVFLEVGQALDNVSTIPVLFEALQDIAMGQSFCTLLLHNLIRH